MKRALLLTLAMLLFFIGKVHAMDIDVWHLVETHTQNGKIIKEQVVDVFRTREEAVANSPNDYTIPGKIERITIPSRMETRYWLIEKQNSGSGWFVTGKQKGPYTTRSEATQNNPGSRTERSNATRYYIREVYREHSSNYRRITGKTEGPFASQAAAQNRANSLGARLITQATYTGSLYLDEGFNETMTRPDLYKTPTVLTSRTFSSLSTARSEVRALIDRTSTAGMIARGEPLPAAVVNIYGHLGVIPNRASLSYSGYKLVALGRVGAYVGLVLSEQTEVGRYFWEPYTSNITQTVNYRWDVNSILNHIPERVEDIEIPPTSVTYSVEKESVAVDVTIHLSK